MAETALTKPEMLRLMQLQGVNYKGAFALSAAVDDVKHFFTEAGQTVLASCADSKLGKWGWSMINRDGEAFFRRKMVGLHSKIGAAPEPATPGGATPSEAKSN